MTCPTNHVVMMAPHVLTLGIQEHKEKPVYLRAYDDLIFIVVLLPSDECTDTLYTIYPFTRIDPHVRGLFSQGSCIVRAQVSSPNDIATPRVTSSEGGD